jgi:hypothetical protein
MGVCAAMGTVAGMGLLGEPDHYRSEDRPLHGEPDPEALWVGGGVAVIEVLADEIADGSAPGVGAESLDVPVFSKMDGLDEGLGKIGEGAGGARLDVTAGSTGDEAAEGGR